MADYAFPELHPEAALQEPSKNLLIYTQTGVDRWAVIDGELVT